MAGDTGYGLVCALQFKRTAVMPVNGIQGIVESSDIMTGGTIHHPAGLDKLTGMIIGMTIGASVMLDWPGYIGWVTAFTGNKQVLVLQGEIGFGVIEFAHLFDR